VYVPSCVPFSKLTRKKLLESLSCYHHGPRRSGGISQDDVPCEIDACSQLCCFHPMTPSKLSITGSDPTGTHGSGQEQGCLWLYAATDCLDHRLSKRERYFLFQLALGHHDSARSRTLQSRRQTRQKRAARNKKGSKRAFGLASRPLSLCNHPQTRHFPLHTGRHLPITNLHRWLGLGLDGLDHASPPLRQ
jgi:hypothetical protein